MTLLMSFVSAPHASPLTSYGIGGLAVCMASLMVILAIVVARKSGLLLGAAIALVMMSQLYLAQSGLLQQWDQFPPPFMLMFVPTVVMTTRLPFSKFGKRLAHSLPIAVLVGMQAFRLPLEILMHHAAREGVMPVQLSYSGLNFDILTGGTAVLVAALAYWNRASRNLVLIWNLMGIGFLTVVVGIALVSMPFVHAFGVDQMNTWVTIAPFVWLPGVLVPIALFLHLVQLRKILMPSEQLGDVHLVAEEQGNRGYREIGSGLWEP